MSLDHVVIRVRDLEGALRWYRDMLGLMVLEHRDGAVFLGCGGDAHIDLGLISGGVGLDHAAFAVPDHMALVAAHQRFTERGARCSALEPAREPGIAAAFRVMLPTGHTFEVVTRDGTTGYPHPIRWQTAAVHAPIDLSHVTLMVDDVRAAVEVLRDQLDFAVSDIVQPTAESPWVFAFTRVGENHHDVALALGEGGGKLHHVAFQVNGVGEIVHFADRLGRFGWKIEAGIGRHGPGGNTFLYVRDPFGNRIEMTADVARVPNRFEPPTVWTGDLSAIFNVWTEEPPPVSFAEGT
jgi:catechol 2,3-dioxygenase